MTDIIEHNETEYLVIGETPDTSEKLELGDRLVLDGLAVEPDGEGYKVLADSPRFVEPTDREADTLEVLVERHMETSKMGSYSGVIISLFIPQEEAKKIVLDREDLPEGSKALGTDELHLTLLFLGDKDKVGSRETVENIVSQVAKDYRPIEGELGGIGRFENDEGDGTNALYASFDSSSLAKMRPDLVGRLANAGVQFPEEHGFTPHITLAYIPKEAKTPDIKLGNKDIKFQNLVLAWGDERNQFEFAAKDKVLSMLKGIGRKFMGEKAAKPMPFVLTERTWAHTDVPAYDIFARETDIRVWNFESPKNPLGGAVVGMPYEASHPFEVTDADGKERSVWSLKRGQSFTVEGGTHFNPTEGHRCRMKVLDTGKVTMVGRDPLEYDFRGQKLKGKYRFELHDAEAGTLTMGKVKMDRGKPEEERKTLGDWAEELGQEAYKALLDHAMETERLAEGEMALLAPEELEDLVENWIEAGGKEAAAGRWVTIRGNPVFISGSGGSGTQSEVHKGLSALKNDNTEVANGKTLYELVKEHGPIESMYDVRKRDGLFEVHQTRDSLLGLADTVHSRHTTADLAKKGQRKAIREREAHLIDLVSRYVPKSVHFTDRENIAIDMVKEVTGTKSYNGLEKGAKAGRRISGEKLNLLKEVKEGFDALMEKMKEFIGWGEYTDRQETMPGDWASLLGAGMKSGFKSFKGRDGKWRWIAWAASAFEDRQQEFFKTKALERYVAEAYKRGDHGKLWFYHLPFAMGDADFTALPGESRILLKMGTWADDPFAQKAADYFSRDDEDWGASVGYKYKAEDREDREYDWLWVFETSPVPADKAAFPFSRFDSFGGKRMDVNEDQKAKLKEVFGEEWKEVLSRVESASKQLEEMGLAYKALQSEGDLMSILGELLADEAIAEKAKANPVQMLKLALGKVKDEAAKGLIQKVIDALEKGDYAYPKPDEKAEEKEEYGKPKEKKAEGEKPKKEEDEEDEDEPKKKGKKETDLPVQIEIEGLSEIVEAVKDLKTVVKEQGEEIVGLKAMLDASDDERAGRKLKKAPPVVAYKASVAGLLDDEEEEGQEAAKMTADHPLARLASGTPLGPRGG